MNVSFIKLLSFNTFVAFVIYLLIFVLFPETSNYFNCNTVYSSNDPIFNIPYIVPISCDLETYMLGVRDFSSIIEFDYNYQTRPLYILFIKGIYFILKNLIVNQVILNFISFLLVHLVIVTTAIYIFTKTIKSLITPDNFNLVYLTAILFLINPIIKYGLFDSSHQTLTFLQFSFSFYLLRKKIEDDTHIYLYTFLIGIASLANTAMLLVVLFLLFHKYKNLNNILLSFHKLLFVSFVLLLPKILWNIYISSQGYIPYNSSTQYWLQFVWLKDFILAGYENVNFNYVGEEYYCMSVPLFLKCYLYDFSRAAVYLSLPILVSATNFYILRKNGDNVVFNMCKDLLLIFGILFSFWAFIGWYPPLRFSLYSLGYFISFLICVQIFFLPIKILLPEIATLGVYFIFLTHWNNLDIININTPITISFLLFFYFIYKAYLFKEKYGSIS